MKKFYSCGSSETTRKAPDFLFDDFYKYGHVDHVPRIEKSFLEWFIGFFEGDGYMGYTDEGGYYRLRFSICQKEKRIIDIISYTFGFGSISSFQQNNFTIWRWSLDSKNSIERIAFLLSGNLIFKHRQDKFLKLIEIGQKKNMFKSPFLVKPWLAKISLQNAWLSGFIDAEGCFYANFGITKAQRILLINVNKKEKIENKEFLEFYNLKPKPRLKQKMTLVQLSNLDTNNIFNKILKLFQGKSLYVFKNRPKGNSYIRIELSSLESHEIISNYLLYNKLKTLKYISFRRWWRVHLRKKNGIHLSSKGIKRLYRLVKAINTHRKELYNKNYIEK